MKDNEKKHDKNKLQILIALAALIVALFGVFFGGNLLERLGIVSISQQSGIENRNSQMITVSFDNKSGDFPDITPKNVLIGSEYGRLTVPVRRDYTFEGWFTSEGERVTASTIVLIEHNHTLFPRWLLREEN